MCFYVMAEAILFIKRDERQDSKIPASRPAAPISKVAILRTRLCLPTSGARESSLKTAAASCRQPAIILAVLRAESELTLVN